MQTSSLSLHNIYLKFHSMEVFLLRFELINVMWETLPQIQANSYSCIIFTWILWYSTDVNYIHIIAQFLLQFLWVKQLPRSEFYDVFRCELHVVAHGQSYRLASGLLKPFLAHLSTLEEQISQGAQSIQLEPSDPSSSIWFTKGTVERWDKYMPIAISCNWIPFNIQSLMESVEIPSYVHLIINGIFHQVCEVC